MGRFIPTLAGAGAASAAGSLDAADDVSHVEIYLDPVIASPRIVFAREVRRLQSRAHRLVWLNPLIGSSNYRPLAEGMSAAMPYIDDFLAVRDLRSRGALAHRLAAIPRRRGSRLTGAVR